MIATHPAFSPYRELLDRIDPPCPIDRLNRLSEELKLRHDNGKSLRFESGIMPGHAADYELSVLHRGIIPTRENNLHDLLNALVWMRFPRLKSAMNLRHCQMLENPQERRQRGALRDQLTLLDESGVLLSTDNTELLRLLEEKCWEELFWGRREDVMRQMTFIVVGHGLLEKCAAPFASMTGKCLFVETAESHPQKLDDLAAGPVLNLPALLLPPLPIQGIPGWDINAHRAYYQNTRIFRTKCHRVPEAHTHS